MEDFTFDSANPFTFALTALAFGGSAYIMGRYVERTVGKRGIIPRILVNAAVLYAIFILLPMNIVWTTVNTLTGALACAVFFNTQKWN